MKKGKLIVIDGLDGSGKATQTKLLIKKLKNNGYKTATINFPQYSSFFGQTIGRYLKGEFGKAKDVSPYLISILYAADRWQKKNKMKKWLKQGKIIICDRYVSSNQIHQTGKLKTKNEKQKFLKWLDKLEFELFKIPKPDLVLFLNVPYKISQKLIEKRGNKKDIHESNFSHLIAAQKQSLELVKKINNWIEIDCVENNKILPKEIISEKIWQTLQKTLKQ
ncbi:dTMP kinase [Candidatus Kuenenbacteria bacterium]|nr:dTMP kinase [Candidatus Kuenenbacteria bacterium]